MKYLRLYCQGHINHSTPFGSLCLNTSKERPLHPAIPLSIALVDITVAVLYLRVFLQPLEELNSGDTISDSQRAIYLRIGRRSKNGIVISIAGTFVCFALIGLVGRLGYWNFLIGMIGAIDTAINCAGESAGNNAAHEVLADTNRLCVIWICV